MAMNRLLARLERGLFAALFLAAVVLLAVLSQRYPVAVDWTDSGRNTLSAASVALLARMPDRIQVRAFVSADDRLREATRQLVERYRRVKPGVSLEFIDPQREPRLAQRYAVRRQGELVIEYGEGRENVKGLSEALFSNALARLARHGNEWVAWLEGPGARTPDGGDRRDLGAFARHLAATGIRIRPLSPDHLAGVPDNVALLVVPQPSEPWDDATSAAVTAYLDRGGNLLWLADPGGASLPALEKALGVRPEAGLLVDPSSRLDGRSTPEFIIISGFADHPLTRDLAPFTAFPTATSLAWEATAGWRVRGLAATGLRAWRETGDLDRAVRFDADSDVPGPLDLAVALERPRPGGGTQRAVVVGDGDFLSNAYLGLGANRQLGSNAVDWLSGDDELVNVPAVMAPDLDYAPDQAARAVIALGAPVVLPIALLAFGLARWRRRRER